MNVEQLHRPLEHGPVIGDGDIIERQIIFYNAVVVLVYNYTAALVVEGCCNAVFC